MTGHDFTCERFEATIDAWTDGELDASTRAAFEAHAAGCRPCADALAHAERVTSALRRLPRYEAPATAVAAVLATARDEAASKPSAGWRWLDLVSARPALAALAAALVLVVALFALVGREGSRGPAELALDDPAVVRATLETKLALAHFARANRRVGKGVSEDLLRERVLRPAVRGLTRAPSAGEAPSVERG